MKNINLLLLFFIVCLFKTNAQSNTNISNATVFNGEPFLAVNPFNNQNICIAWMGYLLTNGQYKIAIRVRSSFDGGVNWSSPIAMPHMGASFGSADVSMAYDRKGLLYMSYIDHKQSPDSGGIYVTRSIDGGLTWTNPIKAFDMYDAGTKKPIDRPWLVVDNSSSTNSGTLFITSKPPSWVSPPNRNYFKSSSDSGKTWSSIANIDGGANLVGNLIAGPMAAPTTTINGNFCAAYPSYVVSQNPLPAYYLAKSKNKGQSFTYSTIVATNPSTIDTNLKAGYRLVANPKDSNQLSFFTLSTAYGDVDIVAYRSNDGGNTWSTAVRVNDDTIANGKVQDLVWASYNENGALAVTWRDRRNSSTNGFWNAGYDFYYSTSMDNGKTFSKNKKISSQFLDFDTILTQNGNDMMCSAYIGDTLYATWADTRTGKLNIFFSKTIVGSNTTMNISQLNTSEHEWFIYPNPSSTIINIQIPKELKGKEIIIYDFNGKKIASTFNSIINVSEYPKGVYYLNLGTETKKFEVE